MIVLKTVFGARCLAILGVLLMVPCLPRAQSLEIYRLKRSLDETTDIGQRTALLEKIAMEYRYYKPDSIAFYADAVLKLAQKENYSKGKQTANRLYGHYHYHNGRHLRAMEHFKTGLKVARRTNDQFEVVENLNMIASCHFFLENYIAYIDFLSQSIALAKKVGHNDQICKGLNDFGVFYVLQKDYTKALESYLEMERIGTCGNFRMSHLRGLGYTYIRLGRFKDAFRTSQELLALARRNNDYLNLGFVYGYFGELYTEQHKPYMALAHYKEALRIYDQKLAVHKISQADVLHKIAELYAQQGLHDSTLAMASRSYAVYKEINNLKGTYESARTVQRAYEKLDRPKKAREYLELALHVTQAIQEEQTGSDVYEAIINSEKKILEGERNVKINATALKNRQKLLGLILLISVAIIALFSIRSKILKKEIARTKRILSEKLLLEKKITIIENSMATELRQHFYGKLIELGDLCQPLRAKDQDLKKDQEKLSLQKISSKLEKSISLLINDIQDLIWATDVENNSVASLAEKLEMVVENFNGKTEKEVRLEFSFDKDYTLPKFANKQLLFSFKEIINNFEKHANTDLLTISFWVQKSRIRINAKDRGKGFKMEKLGRINGLQNIKRRIESLNLSIAFITGENKGVEIVIDGHLV